MSKQQNFYDTVNQVISYGKEKTFFTSTHQAILLMAAALLSTTHRYSILALAVTLGWSFILH